MTRLSEIRDETAARAAQHDRLQRARDLRQEAAGHRAMRRMHLSRKCLEAALILEHAAVWESADRAARSSTGEVDGRGSSAGSP